MITTPPPTRQDQTHELLVLMAPDIDALPWEALTGVPGVDRKVLWQAGDVVHQLLRYAPGATTDGAPHLAAHHHTWVLSGSATIAGHRLTAGCYAHIPPGVAHPTEGVGRDGCLLLHLYRPHEPS